MHSFLKKILLAMPLILVLSACKDVEVKIEGYNNVNTNSTHSYKANVIVDEDEEVNIESYQWSVLSGKSLVVLNNSTTKEVEINATNKGSYLLHVKVIANKKAYEDELMVHIHTPIVMNGHTLPPEPDEEINSATLEGIDSNNNGVRDDVERKIYFSYDKEIYRQQLMQDAKLQQAMMLAPDLIENAVEWESKSNYISGCILYLYNKGIAFDENSVDFIEETMFNTKDRIRKYIKYNQALSGGVYGTPPELKIESSCDFNISKAMDFDK